VADIEHFHDHGRFVDAVNDAVGSPPRAVTASQWPEERFARLARAQGQGGLAELENRRRYGLR
jgi:hypothetical protein